jgi:hypothetical protein
MIQVLVKDIGGGIETLILAGRPASCTVSVYNDQGTAVVSAATATIDPCSTTLDAAAAAGARTFEVADASAIIAGRRYRIGELAGAEPSEDVTVKSVAGTTVTTWAPLVFAHVDGAGVTGLRVSYTVGASAAAALWWDGYAVWTPASGDPVVEPVHCARRVIPVNLIDLVDVLQVHSDAAKVLGSKLDLPQALLDARNELLMEIGGIAIVHTLLGNQHFRRPCALKFWLMRRFELGPDWKDALDAMEKEYRDRRDKLIQGAVPIDADQDGTTNSVEDKAARGRAVRIGRA